MFLFSLIVLKEFAEMCEWVWLNLTVKNLWHCCHDNVSLIHGHVSGQSMLNKQICGIYGLLFSEEASLKRRYTIQAVYHFISILDKTQFTQVFQQLLTFVLVLI